MNHLPPATSRASQKYVATYAFFVANLKNFSYLNSQREKV